MSGSLLAGGGFGRNDTGSILSALGITPARSSGDILNALGITPATSSGTSGSSSSGSGGSLLANETAAAATTPANPAAQQAAGIIWSKDPLSDFPYAIDPTAGGVTTGSKFMLPDVQGETVPGSSAPAYTYTTANGQTCAVPTTANEQWNVANFQAMNPPPSGNGILGDILGVLGGIGSLFLGPEVGALLGIGDIAGTALTGAGLGAAASAAGGGNPLLGAAVGGASGGLGSALSLNSGDILNALGLTSATPAAAPGVTALSTDAGASAAALPSDLGTALGSATPIGGTSAGSFTGLTDDLDPYQTNLGTDLGGLGSAASAPSPLGTAPAAATAAASPAAGGFSFDQIAADAAPGTSTAAPTSFLGGLGSNISGILSSLGITPSGAVRDLAAVGGLGYTLATNQGLKNIPGYQQLESAASTLTSQGTSLQSYLNSGTLPPGAQDAINQATSAAVQQVQSKFAAMGLSGSTMEAQEIASVQQNAAAQGFTIADQLLSQGVSESQLAAELYQSILGANQTQNQQTIGAITGLATALGGGVNLKIGGT